MEQLPQHDLFMVSQDAHAAGPPEENLDGDQVPAINQSESSPSISPSISQSHPILDQAAQSSSKIFLDICAGASRPLSTAILQQGFSVLSFDILLNSSMNLLDNDSFESLLRLASSGQVGYGAASPSCNDYSRIKLKADNGPRAIRTPEHLNGVPNLTHAEKLRIQSSHQMLYRCLLCLSLIFQAGGHCHLEQPANAMSWLEPMTKQFLLAVSAACICIPACQFGWNIYKTWMFASSFHVLQCLGGTCNHPPGSHESIQGIRDQWGNYVSRTTACYPPQLAQAFASAIAPLLTPGQQDFQWHTLQSILPIKQVDDFPFSQVDGGGNFSQPDWSRSDRITPDHFSSLRKSWLQRILSLRMDKMLVAHIQSGSPDPPFSNEQLIPFVHDLETFLRHHNIQPDWSV